jgi:predicted small integral membrane protein
MAKSAGSSSFWKIANGESEVTLPQMTWFVVSFEVVTSTHALFWKCRRWRAVGSPNCAGLYVMHTLTGGTKVAVVVIL